MSLEDQYDAWVRSVTGTGPVSYTHLHDPAARAFLRAELGVQEGEILFGHVGRFCEQKNHAGLLRIFAGVSRRMPNARLVLIGTGELVDSTRALAQELNPVSYTHLDVYKRQGGNCAVLP